MNKQNNVLSNNNNDEETLAEAKRIIEESEELIRKSRVELQEILKRVEEIEAENRQAQKALNAQIADISDNFRKQTENLFDQLS